MPDLYWISGSPPAWRVMLALTVKDIAFNSKRLDHAARENKTTAYLALNPKGQVPTLVVGDSVVRESIAILAWLDRMYPERPIWGDNCAEAARIWQEVILFENDLRPCVTAIASGLLNNRALDSRDILVLEQHAEDFDALLASQAFLGGAQPMANDIWLYPSFHWIARGVQLSSAPPAALVDLTSSRPDLSAWLNRVASLPGVDETFPPHWRKK